MKRFTRAWLALAGTLPWGVLYLATLLGTELWAQVGTARMLGTFAVFAVFGLVAAAGGAALLLAAGLDRPGPRLARVARTGLLAGAAVNLAAIGLSLHFHSAALAPSPYKLGAGLLVAVVVIAFSRYAPAHQAFVSTLLTRLGVLLLGIPLLSTPWLLAEAAQPAGPSSPRLAAAIPRPGAPTRVVLVTFDAWRAQSTSLLNPQARTPHLRALAERSTWFSQARATSDATLNSMTALLTGLPPDDVFPFIENRTGGLRHGRYTGLAGYMKAGGYATASATMLIEPMLFGLEGEFDRGFASASLMPVGNDLNTGALVPWRTSLAWLGSKVGRQDWRPKPYPHGTQAGAVTVDRGLAFLNEAPGPAFLWLHLGLPHTPYYAIAGDPPRPLPSPRVTFEGVGAATEATMRTYEAAYEAYVRYADHELGRVVRALETDPRWKDTLLVVASDHGEEFVTGRMPHGTGHLTEAVTRVPLVIHRAGQTEEERRDRLVSHLDVVPTVLAEVYGRVPTGFEGLPLLEGPVPEDRTVITWSLSRRYYTSIATQEAIAAYRWPFKYLREPAESLYDLSTDAQALRDVSKQHPHVLSALRAHVDAQIRLTRDKN